MGFIKDDSCPFCGQPLSTSAHNLIEDYDKYLNDKEASIISSLESFLKQLASLMKSYTKLKIQYTEAVQPYELYKDAFPDLTGNEFPTLPDVDQLDLLISAVSGLISTKRESIDKICPLDKVLELESTIDLVHDCLEKSNITAQKFNSSLLKAAKEKTARRKKLCTEMANRVRIENSSLITSIIQMRTEYKNLSESIKKAEAASKESKRAIVARSLKKLLTLYFGEKYVLDEESLKLQFKGSELGEDAATVLSDGEKTVLAFCFYIATTSDCIDDKEDMKDLFFVIDDPVSSMDYHYVYQTAQIIRNLSAYIEVERVERERVFVLTHNSAFFNVLSKNQIAKTKLLFDGKRISKYSRASIVPYAEHLSDIARIAKREILPNHTTGNSIRQVIESIWHFEDPSVNSLNDYIEKHCDILTDEEYVYSFCQDQSHAAMLLDQGQPFDQESAIRACAAVVRLIESKFPGQLKVLGINSTEEK